jgi:hypothetical protein
MEKYISWGSKGYSKRSWLKRFIVKYRLGDLVVNGRILIYETVNWLRIMAKFYD